MQGVPHPGRLPVPQAPPAGHATATAHLGRQHLPGDAGLEHKDDPGQGGAVGDAWSATLGLGCLSRQQRGDESPQFVADKRLAHGARVPCHDQVLKGALSLRFNPPASADRFEEWGTGSESSRVGILTAGAPTGPIISATGGSNCRSGATTGSPSSGEPASQQKGDHLGTVRRGQQRGAGRQLIRLAGSKLMVEAQHLARVCRRMDDHATGR